MIYYLKHHGIKGQQWGKKNGPPYPLDAEDHSAAEKRSLKKYISDKIQEHKEYRNRLKTAKNEYATRKDSAARMERAKNFILRSKKATIKRMAKYGESMEEAGKKARTETIVENSISSFAKKAIAHKASKIIGREIVKRMIPNVLALTVTAAGAAYMYNSYKKSGKTYTQKYKDVPIVMKG